jgi:hypothetical protein
MLLHTRKSAVWPWASRWASTKFSDVYTFMENQIEQRVGKTIDETNVLNSGGDSAVHTCPCAAGLEIKLRCGALMYPKTHNVSVGWIMDKSEAATCGFERSR